MASIIQFVVICWICWIGGGGDGGGCSLYKGPAQGCKCQPRCQIALFPHTIVIIIRWAGGGGGPHEAKLCVPLIFVIVIIVWHRAAMVAIWRTQRVHSINGCIHYNVYSYGLSVWNGNTPYTTKILKLPCWLLCFLSATWMHSLFGF